MLLAVRAHDEDFIAQVDERFAAMVREHQEQQFELIVILLHAISCRDMARGRTGKAALRHLADDVVDGDLEHLLGAWNAEEICCRFLHRSFCTSNKLVDVEREKGKRKKSKTETAETVEQGGVAD